jgi:PAS domain S-box-containing protein
MKQDEHPETAIDLTSVQILIDSLPFYCLVVDDRHHIVLANTKMTADLGMPADDLIGQSCPKAIHNMNGPYPGCPLEEALEVDGPVEREIFETRTGQWLLSAIYPLVSSGDRRLFLHFTRDITEAKQTSERLRQSAEQHKAINELLTVIHRDRNPVELMKDVIDTVVGVSWLGLNRSVAAFLVEGQQLRMVAHRNLAPPLMDLCARVPFGTCLCGRAAQSMKHIVSPHMDSDHDIRFDGMQDHGHVIIPVVFGGKTLGILNFYLQPGQEVNDNELRFLDAVGSITGTALNQLDLQSNLAQSDRLSSIGMLAAGVGHEINNPLTYVLYNLETLSSSLGSLPTDGSKVSEAVVSELGELASEALDGARRVRNIVRDLKTFSRSSDERVEPISVNNVIESAINMAFNEIKYRARLVKELGQVPSVIGAEGRLAQVFLNLLVNAAHAIDEGDAENNKIRVGTKLDGEDVVIEIADTGCGIPAEIQPYIFEAFYTTKEHGVGTGLGLSISTRIVQSMDGSISVNSTPGEGTAFTIRLPVEARKEIEAKVSSIPAPDWLAPARGRVLIVDDDELVRRALKRQLGGFHDVVQATNGKHASSVLEADSNFDVILCDLQMPEMSGMDLHKWLYERNAELASRMVFVTGGAFTPQASAFLKTVPNLWIEKPIDSHNLMEIVRNIVVSNRPPDAS